MPTTEWDHEKQGYTGDAPDLADLAEQLAIECRSSQEMTETIQRLALAVLRELDAAKRKTVEWGEWDAEDVLRNEA